MQTYEVILTAIGLIIGVIFGYLQVVVPFIRGELKFSKKFPFVVGTDDVLPDGRTHRAAADSSSGERAGRSKVTTVLVTDLVGFLTMKQRDGDLALDLLEEHKTLLRSIFPKHNGTVLKVLGDKFLVEFTIPLEALLCAKEVQNTFHDRNESLPPEREIRLRIGIHIGEVSRLQEDGAEVLSGDAIEGAFAIEDLAIPGGICISDEILRHVRKRIDDPTIPVGKGERKDSKFYGSVHRFILPWQMKTLPFSHRASFTMQRTGSRILTLFVLFAITFSVYLLFTRKAESGEPIPIAVVDFVNQTGEPELDGLSGMLITSLEQSRRLSVLTRSRMFDILKHLGKEHIDRIDESIGREICVHARLEFLVIASIRKFGKVYSIDLKVLDPVRNEYLLTTKGEGKGQESIPSMIDDLSEETRRGLRERSDEIAAASRNVADVTTINLEAYQHFFKGEELINKLKFDEAIEEFNQALARDSTFALAWYRLAYAIGWANEDLAKKPLDRALALIDQIPEKEQYLVRASKARMEHGMQAGIDVLREMEEIFPDDKEMIYNIGDWSFHISDYQTAITYLEKVLVIDPTFERAIQHLTWTFRVIGDNDKLEEYAAKYVEISQSPEAYSFMALAYAKQGKMEEGLEVVRQVRKEDPKNYFVLTTLSDMFMYSDQFDSAQVIIDYITREDAHPMLREGGAWQLIKPLILQGRYRDAIQQFDELRELYTERADTNTMSMTYIVEIHLLNTGWVDSAGVKESIDEILQLREGITRDDFWRNLALIYFLIGDQSASNEIVLERRDDPDFGNTFDLISFFEFCFNGKCTEAESLIASADLIQGDSEPMIRYILAVCYLISKEPERAIEQAELLGIHASFDLGRAMCYPRRHYLKGRAYEMLGSSELAGEHYRTFIDIYKDGDQDLIELLDAKERLEKLEKTDRNNQT